MPVNAPKEDEVYVENRPDFPMISFFPWVYRHVRDIVKRVLRYVLLARNKSPPLGASIFL